MNRQEASDKQIRIASSGRTQIRGDPAYLHAPPKVLLSDTHHCPWSSDRPRCATPAPSALAISSSSDAMFSLHHNPSSWLSPCQHVELGKFEPSRPARHHHPNMRSMKFFFPTCAFSPGAGWFNPQKVKNIVTCGQRSRALAMTNEAQRAASSLLEDQMVLSL